MTYGIVDVCKRLLDNANLSIDLSGYPNIRCSFLVWGKVDSKFWQVNFFCTETIEFHLENEECFEQSDCYLVLEADVIGRKKENIPLEIRQRTTEKEAPEYLWFVRIFGDATLEITCLDFEYEVKELSEAEYQLKIA